MKKSIASALTAAIVLGVTSTSFATPTDEEVAQLRARVAELERLVREQNNSTASQRQVNNLDYRVTELERTSGDSLSDKLSIDGELRYRFWSRYKASDVSNLQFRLLPTFKVDEHFAVKARINASYDMNNDTRTFYRTDYAYLESKFDNFQLNAGKLVLFSNADEGLVADDYFSGLQAIAGDKAKIAVNLGKFSGNNYAGAEVTTSLNEKIDAGVGYHYFKPDGSDDDFSVIAGGVGFNINEDWRLFGAIAHNTEASSDKTAYNIEGSYKGANKSEKGTWGAYAAYRYVPDNAVVAPTYDTFSFTNKKGFEIGADWTPYRNTYTKLAYFHGKYFGGGGDDRTLFARASIFF